MKFFKALLIVATSTASLPAFQGKYKRAEAIKANQLRDYLTIIASASLPGNIMVTNTIHPSRNEFLRVWNYSTRFTQIME